MLRQNNPTSAYTPSRIQRTPDGTPVNAGFNPRHKRPRPLPTPPPPAQPPPPANPRP